MSARFNRRRKAKPGNVTTADDVRLFQRLAKRARLAEKAAHAVPPPAHRISDSAFFNLVRLGKRFMLLTPAERQDAASDLTAWSAAIETALADVQTAPARSAPIYRAPYAENDL